MASRRYKQYCPLAYSLDVIGDRWALLIVRELLFGPRRFKDILLGLPGIGTNLLASRLKALENAGLLRRSTLPPPAGSAVYQLTTRGQQLRPAVIALAEWGLPLMAEAEEGDTLGVVPTMSALIMLFDEDSGSDAVNCELHVDGEVFQASVGKEIKVVQGTNPAADLAIEAESKTILGLLGRPQQAEKAIRSKKLTMLRGEVEQIFRFFGRFRTIKQAGLSNEQSAE